MCLIRLLNSSKFHIIIINFDMLIIACFSWEYKENFDEVNRRITGFTVRFSGKLR